MRAMSPPLRRIIAIAFLLLLCVIAVGQGNSKARLRGQDQGSRDSSATRLLLGQVTNSSDSPIANAVVYLKNTKSLTMKTYIAAADGSYRFPALSPNVDYQVYAAHQGKRSNVRTLSSFDSRREVRIKLRIDE